MKKINKPFVIALIFLVSYVLANLLIFMGIYVPFAKIPESEIVKNTVTPKDLKGKEYIICRSVSITGYNYSLVRDENGKLHNNSLCLVTGTIPENALGYEYHSLNTYVCYVADKKQYYSDIVGEEITEYIADGWDVLYPSKRETGVFNFAPGYVLKSDFFNLEEKTKDEDSREGSLCEKTEKEGDGSTS